MALLVEVLDALACPVCSGDLAIDEGVVTCGRGHRFDVARQGYVNLLPGGARTGTADTPSMVADRTAFLSSGHLDGLVTATAAAAALDPAVPGVVLDVGSGPGRYLAATLDRQPHRAGIALDLSKHAARRAARAHHRIGAVVSDAWGPLPVRDGAVAVLLDVFAPRNPVEFARVLHPAGRLVVVTPQADHLAELVGPLGLLTIEPDKAARLVDDLGPDLEVEAVETLRTTLGLTRAEVVTLVGMGPSAHHRTQAEVAAAAVHLAEPIAVTVATTITCLRRR